MDIYISGAERTLEKERYLDTSFPYFFENTQIMILNPEVSHKSSAFHSIYSTKVNKFNINKYKINNNSLSDLLGVGVHFVYALLVIGLFTNQGNFPFISLNYVFVS